MKKLLLFILPLLCCVFIANAQFNNADENAAMQLVSASKATIGLSAEDLTNVKVTNTYVDNTSGIRMVYLVQTYQGIPVLNQMLVLAFKNGKLVSNQGQFSRSVEKLANVKNGMPSVTAESAVQSALSDRGLRATQMAIALNRKDNGHKIEFGNMGISRENITAQLMWVPIEELVNNVNVVTKVQLAWEVYFIPKTTPDYWRVRVDASNNSILGMTNLTEYDNWGDVSAIANSTLNYPAFLYGNSQPEAADNSLFDFKKVTDDPNVVNTATYRVIPFPAEAPSFPNGAHATRTDPWLAAPGNATTLKWHTGAAAADYAYSRGNNVWAYEDRTAPLNVGTVAKSANSSTAFPNLTFDFTPDYTVPPTQTTPVPNQQFNITNLFYWNNVIHDVMYIYGWNEASANFQDDNMGRGGVGNDHVNAEAQDIGGTNNANFATPADGGSGRMQMYLWTFSTPQRDGDVDNGIVTHEFGHGISNRFTGGGSAGCLGNAEQMGEGWSDYYGLMFTQNWATSTLNTGFNSPRGIGTYALNQPPTGVGIRSQRYCTDFTVNNKVYAASIPAAPHDRGEIWCATIWDMTWNIINQVGTINANLYDLAGGGGNNIALKLVTEGLRLQQCNPGFISGRNAILAADQALYAGAYNCAIWEAFRRRGMGAFASEGSTSSVTDQTPDFTPPITLAASVSAPTIPEGQNLTYTNSIFTCSAVTNYTLRDTLPTNVTYVSGGTYDPPTRVVSFPVNQGAGTTNYIFTVNVNPGSYFPPVTLLTETVAGATIPASWTTTAPLGSIWTVANTQSNSAPNSFYVNNEPGDGDQRLETTASFALPLNTYTRLSFWHRFNTEDGWDGGVVEISTNGGTSWSDLGPYMTTGGYNGGLGVSPNNPLGGRLAFTGLTPGTAFMNTVINLGSFSGQSVKIRFRFGSDNNTGAPTSPGGWWVDDIVLNYVAAVNMRTSLFNPTNVRVFFRDMVTEITPVVACSPTITQQPTSVTTCNNTSVSFTCVGTATGGVTYQWQLSTAGPGGPWNNLANGAPYGGVTTTTLTVNPAVVSMNGYQYRCIVTGTCNPTATSNAAILTVAATSVGGTVNPPNTPVCGTTNSGTLTLSGHTGAVLRWEFSTVGAGGPYTTIANTTTTLNFANLTQTTWYRAVVQIPGCAEANSSVAVVTFSAAGSLVIIADPGTTICNGDPTLLTVRLGSSTPIGTLYNQPGAAGNGSPSQVFEPANAAFSSQAADDFVVPAGTTWTVTQLNTVGIGAGNPTSVNVFFYNNSAANLPGTAIASFNNVLTFVRTGGNYTVTLPSSVVLAPGQYWVSFQVNMSFATGGQWFWGNFGTTNILNQYAWQNPGGGFGTPCTSWGYGATGCAVGGGVNRNNIFTIIGSSLADGGPLPPGYTYLWTPAAGLSSTTTNPVAAAPMVTTTYTVNVNDGAGCIRQANITITVNQRPTVTAHPVSRTNCVGTTATFTVVGTGTNLAYQWQVSTTGPGGPWTNLTNVAPYSGVNTATLTVNPVTLAMNNNQYRCVLTGICAPIGTANTSNPAILTVNPLPTVTVTPTSGCGGVAGMFGTPLTASGAVTYTWAPLTGLYTDPAATTAYTGGNAATVYAAPTAFTVYTVTGTLSTTTGCSNTATAIINYTPPPPTVVPSSVTMCLGDAAVKLKSSSSQSFSATFNSGTMSLLIPDGPTTWPQTVFPGVNTPNLAASGIPANATITGMSVRLNLTHTYIADMVIVLKAPNNQVLNLSANVNRTGGPGANFINTVISSASTTPLSAGLPPYTGTFQADAVGATYIVNGPGGGNTFPGGPTTPAGYIPTVSNFGGLFSVPNGNYTLGMYDWGFGDLGTLTNWELRIDYIIGVPATSAVWSPAAGLFSDAAATIPYVAGTAVDSVWVRPTPAGVYPYQATVNSLPPAPASFTNPAPISIPIGGNGNPYPSDLTVSGLPTTGVSVSSVIISGISHTWGDDVDIMLQSASGQNVILMSDIGGIVPIPNATYTFSDAATQALNATAANPTGTYRPTNNGAADNFPAPGPGPITQATPTLSMFGNVNNVNGVWRLFVLDDDGAGDQGNIAGGYTINFNIVAPVCTSPPRTVIVTVNQPTIITTQPVDQAICTDKVATFTVAGGGTGPFSYQWQVSTNNGNPPWTNISNGGVYSGATTATLTITAPPVSMNGYYYRAVITGAAPCAPAISFQVRLTVNPLPVIVISASPYISLFPGQVTTLSSTVTPNAAAIYTWLRNGVAVAGANTGTLVVDINGLGDYQLRVTDVNGCTNISNTLTIKDSVSGNCFIYPNPSSGMFQVRYYSTANNVLPRSLTIYDAKGDRVLTQFYTIGRPYDRMDVDMRKYGKGLYWVEIGDMNGNRLTMCRIVIQ